MILTTAEEIQASFAHKPPEGWLDDFSDFCVDRRRRGRGFFSRVLCCQRCGFPDMKHAPDCWGYEIMDDYSRENNIDGWVGDKAHIDVSANRLVRPKCFDDIMPWQLIDWSIPT